MRKLTQYVSLCGLFAFLVACSNSHEPKTSATTNSINQTQSPAENTQIVGGWAPVFLTNMDESQLNDIADGIKTNRIKRVVISYPTKMEPLAQDIHDYLLKKTNVDIPLKSIELKDTDQVKYNLTQVILTLYFS